MGENIIIDGCNVAECYFYYKGECRCELNCIDLYKNETIKELATRTPEHNYMECKPSDNCYFKQLQRAKAEKQDLINYYELREGGMFEDIQYWKNKAQEFYKELEQYKKSKQASYENMQAEWNKAVNELRDVKAENEKLKKALEDINRKNNG